jgi:hypothetical protein
MGIAPLSRKGRIFPQKYKKVSKIAHLFENLLFGNSGLGIGELVKSKINQSVITVIA